jgi:hemerythrin
MGNLVNLWSKQLSIGIDDIDIQHRKLFEIMEEVMGILRKGADDLTIMKTISSLLAYTVEHFTFEEYLMASNGYPDLKGHQALHQEFSDYLNILKQDFQEKGSSPIELEKRVHELIAVWLQDHIRTEDGKYATFLSEKKG